MKPSFNIVLGYLRIIVTHNYILTKQLKNNNKKQPYTNLVFI